MFIFSHSVAKIWTNTLLKPLPTESKNLRKISVNHTSTLINITTTMVAYCYSYSPSQDNTVKPHVYIHARNNEQSIRLQCRRIKYYQKNYEMEAQITHCAQVSYKTSTTKQDKSDHEK